MGRLAAEGGKIIIIRERLERQHLCVRQFADVRE
jgi:hypothetical protein